LNLYTSISDLLNKLAQFYDDSDKETNFQREYLNLTQELSKFNEFYFLFQRLSSYLNFHERQLIINLRDKIILRLHVVWSSQMIQSESFNEIHDYLIYLNNEHQAIKKIKDKESIIKVRIIKQVIFADEILKTFYRKIEVTRFIKVLNSCDVILTNVKDTELQAENCFFCHKSDHISRKCLN
jgi:hypothetical protein